MSLLRCMESRCGLCRFRFNLGDDVVAVKFCEVDTPLRCASIGFEDIYAAKLYHNCRIPCVHGLFPAIGCHPSCLDLLPPALLPEYLRMSAYSLEPLPCQEKARCRWTEDKLASRLEQSIPLPIELRREIASYLPQEYAVIINQSLLSRPKDDFFDLPSLNFLKQHYVEFEGERYLTSLSKRDETERNPPTPKVIYVSEDYRGIRSLVFSQSGLAPEVDCVPGIWWKAIRTPTSNGRIRLHHDGAKIRHLTYYDGDEIYETENASSSDHPQHCGKRFRTFHFHEVERSPPSRISRFGYNLPDTTGISVCCSPIPSILHAHTSSSDLSFYESAPDNSIWCYLPLGEGEHVKEVWMRKTPQLKEASSLAFMTNRRATTCIGPYIASRNARFRWALLDAPDGKPSDIFVDLQPSGIRSLNFDSRAPKHRQLLLGPKPSSSCPYFRNTDSIYWSSASVEKVLEVSICRRLYKDAFQIIGLLLHYLDGTQACLGQVRLDYLDPPVPVPSSHNLYLEFTPPGGGGPHIAMAYMASGQEVMKHSDDNNRRFEVKWSGTLEWWFTYRHCQVWQDGRRSPCGYGRT